MNIVMIAAGVLVLVSVVAARMRGEAVNARRMTVLPLALTVVGFVGLKRDVSALTGTDLGLLAVSAVAALGLGAARGGTIELSERDGGLWLRYRWTTLAVWVVSIATRVGLGLLAHHLGAARASGTSSLLLCLGLTFAAEAAVVSLRASSSGLPPISPKAPRSPMADRRDDYRQQFAAPQAGYVPGASVGGMHGRIEARRNRRAAAVNSARNRLR